MIKKCSDCSKYDDGVCENGIFITFGHEVGLRDCPFYSLAEEMVLDDEYDEQEEEYAE